MIKLNPSIYLGFAQEATRTNYLEESIKNNKLNQLNNLMKMFESNNPKLKTTTGFAQISKNNKVIDISELYVDDIFDIQSDTIYINAKVMKREER